MAGGAGWWAGRAQLLHLRCRQLVQRDLVEGGPVIDGVAAAIAVLHNSSIEICMLAPCALGTPFDTSQPIQSRQRCDALQASTSSSATVHDVSVWEQSAVTGADPVASTTTA